MTALAPTLQSFFTERLIRERQASTETVAAYRDALRLLACFAARELRKGPTQLDINDLDAAMVSRYLEHLEKERGNSVRTRNARLAAVHSLFRYAALRHPEHAQVIQRVLAIPSKRFDSAVVTFLDRPEADALVAAPDRTTWTGRRDHALLVLAVQTGLRASELLRLERGNVHLGTGAYVRCLGKGRKERITPLTRSTVGVVRVWLTERGGGNSDPVFATRTGRPLSRDALERRVKKHATQAATGCPSLTSKRVTAHVLRHTAAMQLLQAGVDTSVISLWLGHEHVDTTQIYLHADLKMKQQALDKTRPSTAAPGRYRPPDSLLAFLDNL